MSRPDRKAMLDRDRRGLSIRRQWVLCRWPARAFAGRRRPMTTPIWR